MMRRHKRLLNVLLFSALLLCMIGCNHFLLNTSNPYLLKIDEEMLRHPSSDLFEYSEMYEAYTGDIVETISVDMQLPDDTYAVNTMLLEDKSSKNITKQFSGPGDLVAPFRTILLLDEKNPVRLFETSRILSIEDRKDGLEIRSIPVQTICFTCMLPVSCLNRVNASTPVQLYFPDVSDEALPGRVKKISETVSGEAFSADIAFCDEAVSGRSGANIRCVLSVSEKKNVLLIPSDCIFTDSEGISYVLIQTGDGPSMTMVKTGINDGHRIEIIQGLNEGDLVYPVN